MMSSNLQECAQLPQKKGTQLIHNTIDSEEQSRKRHCKKRLEEEGIIKACNSISDHITALNTKSSKLQSTSDMKANTLNNH